MEGFFKILFALAAIFTLVAGFWQLQQGPPTGGKRDEKEKPKQDDEASHRSKK